MKSALFRSSACAVALLLASACGGREGGNQSGDTAADTTASFTAAADALAARLKSGVPAVSDPTVKAFEAEASRALKTLGTPALPLRGFDSYDELCGKTATIAGAYVNAGVEAAPEESRVEVMNRNATQYLDQLFTPLLFSAHCTAQHMPFIEKEAGSDVSAKSSALQQVRGGAYGQMNGLLQMAGAADLDPGRRARIADQLAVDAPNFAFVFSQAQRQELATATESVRSNLPEGSRGQVDKIKAALTGAACGPPCKM